MMLVPSRRDGNGAWKPQSGERIQPTAQAVGIFWEVKQAPKGPKGAKEATHSR